MGAHKAKALLQENYTMVSKCFLFFNLQLVLDCMFCHILITELVMFSLWHVLKMIMFFLGNRSQYFREGRFKCIFSLLLNYDYFFCLFNP